MINRTRGKKELPLSRRILNVISLFTGSESVALLCSMVKMKLVALWLGATGVGVFAIFNTTIDTLSLLTGLGIRQSSVREVAEAGGNAGRLKVLIGRIRSWSVFSGLLGGLVISGLAPIFSIWFFGKAGYWWQFMILAGAMIMNSVTSGEQAILQGASAFRKIAAASVRASVTGLALSVPLLRFCGETGVVLSILAYSLSLFIFIMLKRDRSVPYTLSLPRHEDGIASFIRLGGYISMAAFATNFSQFLFISWLNRNASVSEVGFYNAGNTLIVRYAWIILNAVGLEFYPRLSAAVRNPRRISLYVSHEIILLSILFTPLLMLFLLFKDRIVELLYASSFEVIIPFISIGVLSILLRSYSTAVAYTILAKGDGLTYLIVETIDAVTGLLLNMVCYHFMGLTGIGVATVLWFMIYAVMVSVIYYRKYRFRITASANMVAILSFILSAVVIVLDFLHLAVAKPLMLLSAIVFIILLIRIWHSGSVRKRH